MAFLASLADTLREDMESINRLLPMSVSRGSDLHIGMALASLCAETVGVIEIW